MPNFPSMLMAERGHRRGLRRNDHEMLHDRYLDDYECQQGGRTYELSVRRNGTLWRFVTSSQGVFLGLGTMSDDAQVYLARWLDNDVFAKGLNPSIQKIQLKPDELAIGSARLPQKHPLFNIKQEIMQVVRIDEGDDSHWKDNHIITFVLSPAK